MARRATTGSRKTKAARATTGPTVADETAGTVASSKAAGPTVEDRGEVAVADAARIATMFRVLGDTSRCRLVYTLLHRDEIRVGELAERLGMSESNVSHHLSVLRAHGLVRSRREGKQVFYTPDDEHIRLLLDLTLEHVRHGDAAGANGGVAGDPVRANGGANSDGEDGP